MDYEKAYNEMVKRAKELHESGNALTKQQMEVICPELAESEDERMRKEIIEYLWDISNQTKVVKESLDCRRWIAYLEKQKETCYTKRNALFDDCIAKCDPTIIEKVSENVDVLNAAYDYVYNESVAGADFSEDFIKKHMEKAFIAGVEWEAEQKEQKSPNIELIQKSWYMEGYHDRNFGKEPKWIIKTGDGGPKYEENPKYGRRLKEEQKPAEWSEEDEKILDSIVDYIDSGKIYTTSKINIITFLKSIRPSWKPSEEQMRALKYVAYHLMPDENYREEKFSLYEQLKKL